MTGYNAWIANRPALLSLVSLAGRTGDTAARIAEKPTDITIVRRGTALAAQTVRIDSAGSDTETFGEAGTQGELPVLVTGYKSDDAIADTDIQRGDRFQYNDKTYEVSMIVPGTRGRFLAYAEVIA